MGTVTRTRVSVGALTGGLTGAVMILILAGCSSDQPKPMVQPTPEQVRGHADRTFDKLKQEEHERASQPPAAP
ncbi:MAG TPA: hypothetical protein VJ746_15950 [Nitrospira sp.]|nr:hypothetical protein [Nitrospira sp.]